MHSFIFTESPVHCTTRAELPIGITDAETLFRVLAEALSFPEYFGMNWDALDECIRDLSWLPAGHVNLIHHDMPLADNKEELHTYLSVLDSAVKDWKTAGSNLIFLCPENIDHTVDKLVVYRKIFISFPKKSKGIINSILRESARVLSRIRSEKRRVSAEWEKQRKANMERMVENEKMNHIRMQMEEAWAKRDYRTIANISLYMDEAELSQVEHIKLNYARKRLSENK